jgi:hypothetical protein
MNNTKEFWNWFRSNALKYEQLNIVNAELRDKLLDDFEVQLHKYCDKIYFEIGGSPGEPNELIITAEGDANYFEAVESLINDAPVISNWIFIALKPQLTGHFETKWEDIELNTENLYFNPSNNSDKSGIGIIVYIPRYNHEYEDDYYNGLFKMLDTVLGEKSFALDVKSVEIKANNNEYSEDNAIQILKIPAYINWYKANRVS